MALIGQRPRQYDMAIEDGARGIGDGVLGVVTFGEYGLNRRDRAAAVTAVAGALD